LLVVAGLMVRNLQRLLRADRGFEFEQVAVLDASLSRYGIKGATARSYWMDVKNAIASHPETESAALTSFAPLGGGWSQTTYVDALALRVTSLNVGEGFFALMRIPILLGRGLRDSDDPRTAIVISRRLAMEMYGTVEVIGKGFPKSQQAKTPRGRIIVGVA